jgi:hypothetical protein
MGKRQLSPPDSGILTVQRGALSHGEEHLIMKALHLDRTRGWSFRAWPWGRSRYSNAVTKQNSELPPPPCDNDKSPLLTLTILQAGC